MVPAAILVTLVALGAVIGIPVAIYQLKRDMNDLSRRVAEVEQQQKRKPVA